MRVAYVTRSYDGPQSTLNGGCAVALGLEALGIGIEHVQVPATAYVEDGTYPELRTLSHYDALLPLQLEKYDHVLFGEYAFAPYFYLAKIPATMLVHSLWTWDDDTAHVLEYFLPFIQDAIAPTPETFGLFIGRGIRTTELPYPVLPLPYDGGTKEPYVIWVGRAGRQKNPERLLAIAQALPAVQFVAYSSTDVPCLHSAPNIDLRVRRPFQECRDAISKAAIQLSTSRFEVYATTLLEGAISGARILAPARVWGVAHTTPLLYQRDDEAVTWIQALLRSDEKELPLQTLPIQYEEMYSVQSKFLKRRWRTFLVERFLEGSPPSKKNR